MNLPATRSVRGFTMVEIAIALGVIGFALVAIIGILPSGLQVQRDNRSETIINQDATFWLDAIRNGARDIQDLPGYVSLIQISNRTTGVTTDYVPPNSAGCSNIIGLLTTPAVDTNLAVRAYVTAISGSAAEKDPDPVNRELSFAYLMRVLIEPATNTTVAFAPNEPLGSLYELRLTFSYPYLRLEKEPPRSQTFRALVSRRAEQMVTNVWDGREYYFFTPQ